VDKVPKDSLKYLVSQPGATAPIESGFASFRVYDGYMNVVFHDEDGNDLWTTPNLLPRK
jgi:hypothetical protein